MESSNPNPQTETLNINFAGKWWDQNREDRAMPVFEDQDVYQFKRIFESKIGGGEPCIITPALIRA